MGLVVCGENEGSDVPGELDGIFDGSEVIGFFEGKFDGELVIGYALGFEL